MATALAATKGEALKLLETEGVTVVDLDYESGWQDAIELGRLGEKLGIRVQYRGHESIAVSSPAALVAGLNRPKLTFRQRNLYCQFELSMLPAADLARWREKRRSSGTTSSLDISRGMSMLCGRSNALPCSRPKHIRAVSRALNWHRWGRSYLAPDMAGRSWIACRRGSSYR